MTGLHLLTAPTPMVHRPTEVEVMYFTTATRRSLEAWLAAELGRDHFRMTATHLVIETTQGDSRDVGLGAAVIKRRTRDGYEFYPVEPEVIADCYFAEVLT